MQLIVGEVGVILIVGVDPVSRRALWEVLLKRKTHSAIMLVTHFIDEADILADKVISSICCLF
jgi:ABC-type multidrug transport system ATPase subunit